MHPSLRNEWTSSIVKGSKKKILDPSLYLNPHQKLMVSILRLVLHLNFIDKPTNQPTNQPTNGHGENITSLVKGIKAEDYILSIQNHWIIMRFNPQAARILPLL